MSNENTLPIRNHLSYLKQDITDLAKEIGRYHSLKYSVARGLALNIMGFRNSFEFDRWYESETLFIESVLQCSNRLACICHELYDDDDANEAVYVFESEPNYLLVANKKQTPMTIDRLTFDIQLEGLTHQYGAFSLQRGTCQLSVLWTRQECEIRNLDFPGEAQTRKAHCNCKKGFAHWLAKDEGMHLYYLKTAEEITNWADIWGGVACFGEEAMEALKNDNPALASKLNRVF